MVPALVIVPPVSPVPATIEVTVPLLEPHAPLIVVSSPPVLACTQLPEVRLDTDTAVEDA